MFLNNDQGALMKVFKFLLTAAILNVSINTVSANEIVGWSQQAAEDFKVDSCITIPGTPGIPRQCAPSVNVKYPCPKWNNPGRMCSHVVGGPCTPAVPGIPDSRHCASKNLGSFGVKVDGGVYTSINGISSTEISVQNTVSVALFGKHVPIPMTCRIGAGTKTTVCLNMMTGTFTKNNTSGASCEIAGVDLASLTYPGVTANVCTDFDFNIVKGKPVGSVDVRVESEVEFGSASVAGHTLHFGNKSWNPTILRMPLP